MFVVLDGVLWVVGLKEKVAHGKKSKRELFVDA